MLTCADTGFRGVGRRWPLRSSGVGCQLSESDGAGVGAKIRTDGREGARGAACAADGGMAVRDGLWATVAYRTVGDGGCGGGRVAAGCGRRWRTGPWVMEGDGGVARCGWWRAAGRGGSWVYGGRRVAAGNRGRDRRGAAAVVVGGRR